MKQNKLMSETKWDILEKTSKKPYQVDVPFKY